jgi:hypothetical protein
VGRVQACGAGERGGAQGIRGEAMGKGVKQPGQDGCSTSVLADLRRAEPWK